MMYLLLKRVAKEGKGYLKRKNKYNNGDVDGIGYAQVYKTRKQADFANSELRGDYKVIMLSTEEYRINYEIWYENEFRYKIDLNKNNEIEFTGKPRKDIKIKDIKDYPRDIEAKNKALQNAQYRCEFDREHSYVRMENGREYVEGHHLIPLKYFEEFEYDIDVPENIVSLCVVCHKILHHGNEKEKEEILTYLFSQRQDDLRRAGINISLEHLLHLYGID